MNHVLEKTQKRILRTTVANLNIINLYHTDITAFRHKYKAETLDEVFATKGFNALTDTSTLAQRDSKNVFQPQNLQLISQNIKKVLFGKELVGATSLDTKSAVSIASYTSKQVPCMRKSQATSNLIDIVRLAAITKIPSPEFENNRFWNHRITAKPPVQSAELTAA